MGTSVWGRHCWLHFLLGADSPLPMTYAHSPSLFGSWRTGTWLGPRQWGFAIGRLLKNASLRKRDALEGTVLLSFSFDIISNFESQKENKELDFLNCESLADTMPRCSWIFQCMIPTNADILQPKCEITSKIGTNILPSHSQISVTLHQLSQ